jgi:beta-ureidopropionase
MKLALVQQHCTRDPAENLQRALQAMDHAKDAGADMIAFPELAVNRFFPQEPTGQAADRLAEPIPGPTSEVIANRAARNGLVTVFNMYEIEPATGHRFDSSPIFDADGTLLGVTRMVHITDYACFHEQAYYHPGDHGAPVYETRVGRIGIAICYDRHYPEYMRALGVRGADLVVIPQAGATDEWPAGLFEAEVRTAAFQNGYFAALCNRVGQEERLTFGGESFVVDPSGLVIARAKPLEDQILFADLDLHQCTSSHARQLFWRDRRPGLYRDWLS